ncbi:WXG100 family type VII secretion target [Streptomyces nodosus]|uniref:WXG100 family type VII secretion target n=2 Tax=Streptomyces TaxID=1883 RepID=A0A0B5DHZ1_9ACTN|nr:hypothetical protein SNOD_24345 [Streptomyces nodosus]MYV47604.1 hypothetical protein [Streptomyces sp. SID2888]QEV41323.1 WXG100 family type VII secretion target [Streptomyces nodosus]
MAQGQRLTDSQMAELEKKIAEKFENIRTRVHKLQGVIDGLEGQWHGIGRAEFDKKQYEINESLARMGRILTEFLDAMTGTRKIKDDSEEQVRETMRKIDLYDGASTVPKSPFAGY